MATRGRLDDPRLRHLSQTERQAVARFWEQLERALPGRVERLILFGSRARGDGHPASDVDLLVVVDQRTPEVDDAIIASIPDLLPEEVDIQVVGFSRDEAAELIAIGTPLMRNVADEGIVLKGEAIVVGKGDPAKVAQGFIESAYGRLRSARALRDIGEYGNAMSLVFYAFLDAADAALVARDIRTRSHAGTIDLFGLHFIEKGLVEAKYSKWFKQAQKFRLEADYERKRDFSPKQVETAIAQAEEFVKVVEALLTTGQQAAEKHTNIV